MTPQPKAHMQVKTARRNLTILKPLLIAHPLRLVVVLVDFTNCLHHLPALDGEDLFEFLELSPTMGQAVGVDRLSHLLPVDRRRGAERDTMDPIRDSRPTGTLIRS